MSNFRSMKEKRTPVVIDGKEMYVLFDLNAIGEIEDKFETVQNAFKQALVGKVNPTKFILWAGLQHWADENEEELTLKQLGKMLDLAELQKIGQEMNKALEANMPEAEVGEEKNGEKAKTKAVKK